MTEYERLKKQGYTEEQIQVELSKLSGIDVTSGPLGINREDRSVNVRDNQGNVKKTTSIMMGYNKKRISLDNGKYISFEEFEEALKEELSKDGNEETLIVSKRTGKRMDISVMAEEILKEITAKSSFIKLEEDSKVLNQDSAHMKVVDHNTKKEHNKGIMMLGNGKVKMPNGDYVLVSEIEQALHNYIVMNKDKKRPSPKPQIDPIITGEPQVSPKPEPTPNEPIKEEVYEVIRRYINRYSWIPTLIATIIIILKGFGLDDKMVKDVVTSVQTNADFSVSYEQQLTDKELENTTFGDVVKLKTGEKIEMPSDTKFYSNSEAKYNNKGIDSSFGTEVRPAGQYNIDYISINHNGKSVNRYFEVGKSVDEMLQETSEKLGVDINDLDAWIHVGGPVAGWVSVDDIVNGRIKVDSVNKGVKLEGNTYNGSSEFNNGTITFNNGTQDVTINVVDVDGNLLSPGSIVKGSDGEDYCLDNIELQDMVTENEINRVVGKKLTWSVHNIGLDFALATAALGLAATLVTKKRKAEMTTMTEKQIEDLTKSAREKFDDGREFTKAVQNITQKQVKTTSPEELLKDDLINQNITIEDINNLGGMKK